MKAAAWGVGSLWRRGRIALLAVACAAVLGGCGTDRTAEAGEGDGEATPVDAVVVRSDTLSLTITSVGSLEADARVEVKPELDGIVSEIHFREGEEVEAGEILVRLDRNKLQARLGAGRAALERARAEEENLRTRLRRNDSLLARGAISQQAYDDLKTSHNTARARLEEARANLELARAELEDATIRAPFDGWVGSRSFDLGDYVREGESLFTVVDNDPMEIEFTVPERYLGQLSRGSPVRVRVRSLPDRDFEGEVTYVSPYVDSRNRTVALKASIPNRDSELRDGQFANVRLQLGRRAATLVPEAAILARQEGSYVFLVRGGKAVRAAVTTGAREEGVVEILSGAGPGDTVVVAGHQRLRDGTPVEPSFPPDAAPPPAEEPARSDGPGSGGSGSRSTPAGS